jgi:hypothetical protein
MISPPCTHESFLFLFFLPHISFPSHPRRAHLHLSSLELRGALFFSFIMSERYIPEHRRTQFKARNQFKPDELRRRREEQQVEIRKQKREENLAKRRGIQTSDGGIGVGGGMAGATESDDEASAIESEVCLTFFFLSFLTATRARGQGLKFV